MEKPTFHYQPTCSAADCQQPAVYKVAAPWSNGTQRELKNYGLSCEAHRESQLSRGQTNRQGLKLAEGETMGQVGLYKLVAGKRDVELPRVAES
jgi:hypothetical protein